MMVDDEKEANRPPLQDAANDLRAVPHQQLAAERVVAAAAAVVGLVGRFVVDEGSVPDGEEPVLPAVDVIRPFREGPLDRLGREELGDVLYSVIRF